MIIEYKQQSILETQILEFPDISDNSSFPTRAGQGVKLSRVFVFLCSSTCIPNSKTELECIIKKSTTTYHLLAQKT